VGQRRNRSVSAVRRRSTRLRPPPSGRGGPHILSARGAEAGPGRAPADRAGVDSERVAPGGHSHGLRGRRRTRPRGSHGQEVGTPHTCHASGHGPGSAPGPGRPPVTGGWLPPGP
jgi:hypothetical protein